MTTLENQLQDSTEKGSTRFQVRLPMRFRPFGERVWRDGWAETMSLNEILFRTANAPEVGKGLDIRIALPVPKQRSGGGTIVSKGRIVRCFTVSGVSGEYFVAASLTGARLLHGGLGSGDRETR